MVPHAMMLFGLICVPPYSLFFLLHLLLLPLPYPTPSLLLSSASSLILIQTSEDKQDGVSRLYASGCTPMFQMVRAKDDGYIPVVFPCTSL